MEYPRRAPPCVSGNAEVHIYFVFNTMLGSLKSEYRYVSMNIIAVGRSVFHYGMYWVDYKFARLTNPHSQVSTE